jgi:hypothetical protein
MGGLVADDRRLRRWVGWAVFVVGLVFAGWLLPRILPRSPVTIVVLCVLAILAAKLAERRIRALFGRAAARRLAALRRSPPHR